MWDVFICHASEDKQVVARPLAERLRSSGVKVWIDETELRIGDSLRKGIDKGLANSRFGIVILSPSFFNKQWTQAELGALISKETLDNNVVLPIWYYVQANDIKKHSPLLADRVAAKWEDGIDVVVFKLLERVQPSSSSISEFLTEVKESRSILNELLPQLNIIGPNSIDYNSFSWAAGDETRWWSPDPEGYWPIDGEALTMGGFLRAFETLSYRVCPEGKVEDGYEKIAIHINELGQPTHAARQIKSGLWTSKLGSLQKVEYKDVNVLNPLYGNVAVFMKRPFVG
jgi:TIR domain